MSITENTIVSSYSNGCLYNGSGRKLRHQLNPIQENRAVRNKRNDSIVFVIEGVVMRQAAALQFLCSVYFMEIKEAESYLGRLRANMA